MKAYSRKYPSLVVSDARIRFIDGEADVPDDPEAVAALRKLEPYGVELEQQEEKKPTATKRSRSRRRE